jgi:ABC-type Na+ transport system ATPase subunit NatA
MVTELMTEKSKGIKLFMTVAGLPTSVHVLSWAILNIAISIYFSAVCVGLAYLFQFRVFVQVPPSLWYLYFFLTSFASNSLALLISSFASKDKTGFSLAYIFLMFSFVFQVFMTNPNSTSIFYSKQWLLKVLRRIFEFYPGFNYIKIWNDIIHFSGTYFDIQIGRYVVAPGMTWANVFERYEKFTARGRVHIPSLFDTILILFRNITFFYILIFVFEKTLASNQGVGKNPFSWLFRILFMKRSVMDSTNSISSLSSRHPSVIQEEKKVEELLESNDKLSLIVNGISRDFSTGYFSTNKQQALKEVKLTANTNEILTILGQNGAGKTTLINIITGYLQPTKGDAMVMGNKLSKDIKEIRRITSLCPQSDIYWQDLTIMEHLMIFGIVKGFIDPEELEAEAHRILNLVELTNKSNQCIGHLSGGMKRRLSIAISAMGDPKIIIFDEPTNGLDPLKRLAVLNLINVV